MEQEGNGLGRYDHPGEIVISLTPIEEKYRTLLRKNYALVLENQALRQEKRRRETALDFNMFVLPSDCVPHPWNYKRDLNDFGLKKVCFPPPDSQDLRTLLFKNLGWYLQSCFSDRDWVDLNSYRERPRFITEASGNLSQPPFPKKKGLLEYVSLQHRVVMSTIMYKENTFFAEERSIMRKYGFGFRRHCFGIRRSVLIPPGYSFILCDPRKLPLSSPILPKVKHSLKYSSLRPDNIRRKSGIRGK